MKAAQLNKYSKDFKLQVNDIPVPEISDTEVLVQVRVAAVNPLEMLIGTGSVKFVQDYSFPLTMGNELTGVVTKVGKNVNDFKIGDEIYSRLPLKKIGAFAEYAAINHNAIALLPKNLDMVTGAAAALTGLTAYQGLHEELAAKSGETVFIPGGSGSFGQMAIPIAKDMGLKVIVSGNAQARERTLAIGADQYLSYETENYWEIIHDVDYVIDTLGPRELEHEISIIKPGGRLLSLRMGPNKRFAIDHNLPAWKRMLFSMVGRKFDKAAAEKNIEYHFIFVRSDGRQLRELTRIIESNDIVPAVDPTEFSIDNINQALDLVANGRPKGKVVIKF